MSTEAKHELYWLESVPSGLRWFCYDCDSIATGFSELEHDEAYQAMHRRPYDGD